MAKRRNNTSDNGPKAKKSSLKISTANFADHIEEIIPNSEIIPISNKFDSLSGLHSDGPPNSVPRANTAARVDKVPPITVQTPDFVKLQGELQCFAKELKFNYQVGGRGMIRIFAGTLEGRQKLMDILQKNSHKFFTYDTKSERSFKVVLKGLTNDKTLTEVSDEIKKLLGVDPTQVVKMKTKAKVNSTYSGFRHELFLVHFNRSQLNNIKLLRDKANEMFLIRVDWEHYERKGQKVKITQCRKCQGWGHGTKNCFMLVKCMLCGENHPKEDCPKKDNSQNFQCANCGGNHKSNDWNCPIRQKIISSKTQRQLKNMKSASPSSSQNFFPRSLPIPTTTPGLSYAQALTLGTTNGISSSSHSHTQNHDAGIPISIPIAGSSQRPTIPMGTSISTVKIPLPNTDQCSGTFPLDDLGDITQEKFELLQSKLFAMVQAMLKTNSMADAIQTGFKFANDIVISLKFSHGFK